MNSSIALSKFATRDIRERLLPDGTPVRMRPIRPEDKDDLQSGMTRMSADSRYRRFMMPLKKLSPEWLRNLTEIDYSKDFAIGVQALVQDPPLGIAVARYVRDRDDSTLAEPAVTVVDAYQGLGLGSLLLGQLIIDARQHGIERFRAWLLADNTAMKRLFLKQGARLAWQGDGTISAEFSLADADHSDEPTGNSVHHTNMQPNPSRAAS